MWNYLQSYRAKHEAAGNGFGFSLVTRATPHTRTISARYHKDGSEALVARGQGANPRRLTPLECLRLQGFPKRLEKWFDGTQAAPVSDTQAYRQFGNSVAVPVVTAVALELAAWMSDMSRISRLPFAAVPATPQQRPPQSPQVELFMEDDDFHRMPAE
jgi:DNA (cytosine-5)-methyltransferase 1